MKYLIIGLFLHSLSFAQVPPLPNKCEADATYVYQRDYIENLSELELVAQAIHHTDPKDLTDVEVSNFSEDMMQAQKKWKALESELEGSFSRLNKLNKSFDKRPESLKAIEKEETKLLAKLNQQYEQANKRYQTFTSQFKHQLSDVYFLLPLRQDPIPVCSSAKESLALQKKKIEETERRFSDLRRTFFKR